MSARRRKVTKVLPESFKDYDFQLLSPWTRRTYADWMGVRAEHDARFKSEAEKKEALKAVCMVNSDVAQRAYEAVVLLRLPANTTGDTSAQLQNEIDRVRTTLYGAVASYDNTINEKAAEAVMRAAEDVSKILKEAANGALLEAAKSKVPLVIKQGTKTRKVEGVLPKEFETMVQLASARIPIMLVGPAGCGKTYLAEKVAEALGLEYSDQSCSEGMSESIFNGRLLPIGKGGAFEHVASPWIKRYETGGVMLLDEIDAGDPNLFTYINKAVANSSYTVEQRFANPVVKKHKDFTLIAAANTFGHGADSMYVGRNQLDAATLDRFKVGLITMDYSREVEQSLAPLPLCEWAWGIRDRIRTNKLRRIMSTRVIKDLSTMTELYGWERKEWEAAYFAGWTDSEANLVKRAA